jgi:hypothetical protein
MCIGELNQRYAVRKESLPIATETYQWLCTLDKLNPRSHTRPLLPIPYFQSVGARSI